MVNDQKILNGDYLSLGEVAELRGVTRSCVLAWLAHGLKHKRAFDRVFIRRRDAESYVPKKPGKKAKLTEQNLAAALRMRKRGMTFAAIGKAFRVTGAAVHKALAKKAAKNVPA